MLSAWGTAVLLVAGGAIAVGQAQTGCRGSFEPHVVATDLARRVSPWTRPTSTRTARSICSRSRAARSSLIWFENPSWTRHVIASGIHGLINAAAFDTDKDGIPEIAIASGFATDAGEEHRRRDAAIRTARMSTRRGRRRRSIARRRRIALRWIDAEGNGRKWLINAPLGGVDGGRARLQGQDHGLRLRPCRLEAADGHRC